MDEATQVIASFLSDRSALPEDGGPSGLTLGSVVNLFTLLLRPGEKLVAYADRLEDLGEERGSARQSVDLVALTDMRMVRSRIANDAFVWKETPLPAEAALGVEAFVGRAGENDPRWWIADEPEPARFSIHLPESLLLDGDAGQLWMWTSTATAWSRRPVHVFNLWSEALHKMRRQ